MPGVLQALRYVAVLACPTLGGRVQGEVGVTDHVALAFGGAVDEEALLEVTAKKLHFDELEQEGTGVQYDCVPLEQLQSLKSSRSPLDVVKTWCGTLAEEDADATWMSCPVCWDSCQSDLQSEQLWLHATLKPKGSLYQFMLGDRRAVEDEYAACAKFSVDLSIGVSQLQRLGAFARQMQGICNDVRMKVIARWHVGFLQKLGIGDLDASDKSFFVCPEIRTLPLRVAMTGRTLYEGMYTRPNDSGDTSFSYMDDDCLALANAVHKKAQANLLLPLAQRVVALTRGMDKTDRRCATDEGQAAKSTYLELMTSLGPEADKFAHECEEFTVAVADANANMCK